VEVEVEGRLVVKGLHRGGSARGGGGAATRLGEKGRGGFRLLESRAVA
jgi:hypothetical protein